MGVPLYKTGKRVQGQIEFEQIPTQFWSEIDDNWDTISLITGDFEASGRDDAEQEDEPTSGDLTYSDREHWDFTQYQRVHLDIDQVIDLLSQRQFIPPYFQAEESFTPEPISAASSKTSMDWAHWSYIVITMATKGRIHAKSTPNSLITDAKDKASVHGWTIPSDNTVRQAAEFLISGITHEEFANRKV
jgi:hypothetical protein